MKVSTELLPDHQSVVTVEVDQDQLQKAMQKAAQRVSRLRPVPGFRPGKAPYNTVERVFGRDLLLEDAVDQLSNTLYPEILKEQNIEPAAQGKLEVVQKEPPILKYTIPLKPEVKLGDYAGIRVPPKEVEVTDKEVDEVIERFQASQATMVPVSRAIQKGDVVTLDVQGGVPDHEPVDEKNLRLTLGDSKGPGLPFEDQLVGMNPGETKEIDYSYPEDYADEAFRGKTAHYRVTINDVKETQLPEVNDEFAKAISQFQTLDQFRGSIRDILRRQKEREAEGEYADQVIDTLVERSEIAYPPIMVDAEVEHQVEHLHEDMRRLGLTWDKYLELSGKSEEQVRQDMRPNAEKQLKRMLVVSEVMEREAPEITREEVDEEINRLVEQTEKSGGNPGVARRSYTGRDGRKNIESNLKLRMSIAKLVAMAKGEPVSGKILTPEMVRDAGASPVPSGLITDPSQVREADWPKGLERK